MTTVDLIAELKGIASTFEREGLHAGLNGLRGLMAFVEAEPPKGSTEQRLARLEARVLDLSARVGERENRLGEVDRGRCGRLDVSA